MHSLVYLAWRSVAGHRLRSSLTAAAISIGISTAVAAAVVGQAAGRQTVDLAAKQGLSNTLLVQAGLTMAAALLLFTAGLIILNAFNISLAQRMREIGLLRAVGMSRRQIRNTVLVEAGVLGLIGAAVGTPGGLALGWAVMQITGTAAAAPLRIPWWGVMFSPLLGLGITVAGALHPARRAGRILPLAAIQPVAEIASGWYLQQGGRLGIALSAVAVVGLAGRSLLGRPDALSAQAGALIGQSLLFGAAILLMPVLIKPLAAVSGRVLPRWIGVVGELAAGNLHRNPLRSALSAGAMAVGLTAIVATSGLMTAGLKGSLERFGTMLHEDCFVVHDIVRLVSSGELSVANFYQFIAAGDSRYSLSPVEAALEPLAGAGMIRVERARFVAVPPELSGIPGSPAIAVDPDIFLDLGNFDFFEGNREEARATMASRPAVLIQPMLSQRLGVHVGDTLQVATRQGPVDFTIAGIGGSAWNMTILSYDTADTYLGTGSPTHLGIVVPVRDPAGVEAALAAVRAAIAPFPGVIVHASENPFDPLVDMVGRLETLLQAFLLLAVVASALGMTNTVVVNITERRREIGLFRAVGATQRQVQHAVLIEAGLLGLLAALVTGVLGLAMLLAWAVMVLPGGTASVGVRPDWLTVRMTMLAGLRDLVQAWAATLVGAPLIAGLAAWPPARAAAAANVVEATRFEG